jgi:flavin-dependent dehydrogenase
MKVDPMTVQETSVLIVGAGPAGLTAAITLATHGIDFVLAERRLQPSPEPRANGVSTRAALTDREAVELAVAAPYQACGVPQ